MKTIELMDEYGEKEFILLHTFGMDDETTLS